MSSDAADEVLRQLGVSKDYLIEFERERVEGKRLLFACLTVLLYDYCLTFGDEITFVWLKGTAFSVAKALFWLNRYWPIANYVVRAWLFSHSFLSPYLCKILPFTGWSSVINFAVVEIVLMLRVWALYDRSRWVIVFFGFLFVGGLSGSFALRKVRPEGVDLAEPPPISLTRCVRSGPDEYFFLYTIGLIIETTIFIFLVSKAWTHAVGPHKTPMITVLLRQGAIYYAVVLLTLTVVIISTVVQPMFAPVADSNLIVAITSIACNRLILSLRGVYFKQRSDFTSANTAVDVPMSPNDIQMNRYPVARAHSSRLKSPRHLRYFTTFSEDEQGGVSVSHVGRHT